MVESLPGMRASSSHAGTKLGTVRALKVFKTLVFCISKEQILFPMYFYEIQERKLRFK
jgi:hypothetical protein